MRKIRIQERTLLFLIFSLLLIAWLLWIVFGSKQEELLPLISVVEQGSNNERWRSINEGMQQAAIDNHVSLNMVATNQFMSENDEWDLIENEIKNGANAVIVDPVGSKVLYGRLLGVHGIPIVLLGSDIDEEKTFPSVSADNYAIGKRMAQAMYNDYGEELKQLKIGIVSAPSVQIALTQRQKGFADALKRYGISYSWSMGLDRSLSSSLERQLGSSKTDIIVCMGNQETEIAVDCVLKNESYKPVIYGEGYSEKNIYYLDQEVIKCLVMSNEYYMGYYSVALAADKLKHGKMTFDQNSISLYTLHKKDIYDEEIQKIVFPLIQ